MEDTTFSRRLHQILSEASMNFTVNLGNQIHAASKEDLLETSTVENHVFSPFNLQSALGMLLLGAAGETWKQIWINVFPGIGKISNHDTLFPGKYAHEGLQAITKKLTSGKNSTFRVGSRLYIQHDYTLLDPFVDNTEKCYSANATNVDFSSSESTRTEINNWVKEITMDTIPEIIQRGSLSQATRMVLVNAIYFYGTWKIPFMKDHTQKGPFRIPPNQVEVEVDMMQQTDSFLTCQPKGINARVLQMKYTDDKLSMVFILPDRDGGMLEVETAMQNFNLTDCLMSGSVNEIMVKIPKFEIKTRYDMKKVLTEMGMEDMFTSAADFSRISTEPVLVSEVIHEAFIKVDEEGSEASAATAIVLNRMNMPSGEFYCDHPFMFMIVENDFGTVLFTGKVSNPTI